MSIDKIGHTHTHTQTKKIKKKKNEEKKQAKPRLPGSYINGELLIWEARCRVEEKISTRLPTSPKNRKIKNVLNVIFELWREQQHIDQVQEFERFSNCCFF